MIAISEEQLTALVAARVAEVLGPERLDAIAAAHIERRIGALTLEEARERMRFGTQRKLKDWCRAHRVPWLKVGREWLIRIGDIERAQEGGLRLVPDPAAKRGTRIGQRVAAG